MTRRGGIAWVAAGVLAAQAAIAEEAAQAPAPRPKVPATITDPAFEAMRPVFEALPEAERKGLQDALVWTGDYNSVVTGGFGRRTFEALNAFRARTAPTVDSLDPKLRAAIVASGEAARRAAHFAVKPDPASGAILGVPERMLPKRTAVPGGTRWQSTDGRLTLETRSFPLGSTNLDALFERATAPLPERKVTYKLKRPDFVVVTAETGAGRSYIRYASGSEGIRGFAIGYDRAMAAEVDRLVIAVANSFVPFPEKVPAPAEVPSPAPPPTASPAVPVPAGTGLVVAAGRVLTASAVTEACPALRIGTAAARVLRGDPARGLALLEAPGLPPPRLPAARAAQASEAEGLVVVAAEGTGIAVAPGTGSGAVGVLAPLQPGAGGAPVLDRAGALAGIVARFPPTPRLIAGVTPPARFSMVPGGAVAAFLAEDGIAPAPPSPGGGSLGLAAGAVGGAVVGLACAR